MSISTVGAMFKKWTSRGPKLILPHVKVGGWMNGQKSSRIIGSKERKMSCKHCGKKLNLTKTPKAPSDATFRDFPVS